jgi:hypothetical protein
VSAPAVLLSPSPRDGERSLEEEGLSLLLELLTEPPETDRTWPRWTSPRRPGGAGWRELAHGWVRSAAGWGAGPEGAWRAW